MRFFQPTPTSLCSHSSSSIVTTMVSPHGQSQTRLPPKPQLHSLHTVGLNVGAPRPDGLVPICAPSLISSVALHKRLNHLAPGLLPHQRPSQAGCETKWIRTSEGVGMVTGHDTLSIVLSVFIATGWLRLDASQTRQTQHVYN